MLRPARTLASREYADRVGEAAQLDEIGEAARPEGELADVRR